MSWRKGIVVVLLSSLAANSGPSLYGDTLQERMGQYITAAQAEKLAERYRGVLESLKGKYDERTKSISGIGKTEWAERAQAMDALVKGLPRGDITVLHEGLIGQATVSEFEA